MLSIKKHRHNVIILTSIDESVIFSYKSHSMLLKKVFQGSQKSLSKMNKSNP